MNVKMTKEQFKKSIIAQDDDGDYSESGYVAVVFRNKAHLGKYSHCSCFDTVEALCDELTGIFCFLWSGSVAELVKMAKNRLDPAMPKRVSDENDCDYDHLMAVYAGILQWKKND